MTIMSESTIRKPSPTRTEAVESKPRSRAGGELKLGVSMKGLATGKQVTSAVGKKVAAEQPLLTNDSLQTIAKNLLNSKQYGAHADKKLSITEMGGIPRPGIVSIGIEGTGISLPFFAETGKPMGSLDPKPDLAPSRCPPGEIFCRINERSGGNI